MILGAELDDRQLARALAETAGKLLVTARDSGLVDGKALGAMGDVVAHHFLVHALKALRPDDAVLSEEAAADPARLSYRRVWIVDPLDGTREYSERRNDWAVHVALAVDGVAAIGAVAQPDLGITYDMTCSPPTAKVGDGLKIVVSRTRPPAEAEKVAASMGAELVGMGSAGAKTMAVVRGEVDAYVHSGGQYEWDSCAPVAVAQAAGLHVSRLDGSPMRYNQPDPYLPDLLVCRAEYAERLLAAINA
ncbi:MAG: 3(2),5-bisphosphate nucleotidase CysQ [Caulobacteraceae bacterium]|nr:3(2),5-bisphosphate nucleotidase CysQ [Caulobacteraceae bacterium]